MPMRWSYKLVEIATKGWSGEKLSLPDASRELDRLGGEGWELVSCFHMTSGNVIAVFKRPG